MKTNIKEAARTPACISAGDEFPEPHMEERQASLPWYLTADEWLQRRMPWNGLTLAAAIVLAIAVGVLLGHAWGRLG